MYLIIIALIIGLTFYGFQTISSVVFDLNNFTENRYNKTKTWFLLLTIINIFLLLSILFFYYIYKNYQLRGNLGPQGYQGAKGNPGDNTLSCINKCNNY